MSLSTSNNLESAVSNSQLSGDIASNGDSTSAFGLRNEFLTMMVAQVQNQDPLNPLDGTEYVSQLAQFSMVEGVEYLRQGQAEQADLMYTQQVLQSTSLVGKQVLVPSRSLVMNEAGEAEGQLRLPAAAESVTLKVKDLNGNVVEELSWSNADAGELDYSLSALTEGTYTLEAEAKTGDSTYSLTPYVSETVERVSLPSSGGDIQLSLSGLGNVSLFSVTEFGQEKKES